LAALQAGKSAKDVKKPGAPNQPVTNTTQIANVNPAPVNPSGAGVSNQNAKSFTTAEGAVSYMIVLIRLT
jgi:hypothetical protein